MGSKHLGVSVTTESRLILKAYDIRCVHLIVYIYISGWWFQPLWKILVRLDHHPNYCRENKSHVPNHQPDIYIYIYNHIYTYIIYLHMAIPWPLPFKNCNNMHIRCIHIPYDSWFPTLHRWSHGRHALGEARDWSLGMPLGDFTIYIIWKNVIYVSLSLSL